jgi:hypothetical protein
VIDAKDVPQAKTRRPLNNVNHLLCAPARHILLHAKMAAEAQAKIALTTKPDTAGCNCCSDKEFCIAMSSLQCQALLLLAPLLRWQL